MGEEEKARKELATLLEEHKQLDLKIAAITADATFDQLLVQRMKRRKLWLKDRISYLQEFLCDDIIA
jgi:hypothetical protein